MKTGKIIGLSVVALGLFGISAVSAQYYNQYGYQYPAPQYNYVYPGPYAPSSVCPNLYSNLVVGSSGAQVSELQQFLASRGYSQSVTGYYGSVTSANVAQFQREQGISPASGGTGPLTRAAIARVCAQGGYTPGYPTQPQYSQTFRLDREFDLYQGQSAHERSGELTVTLDHVGGNYSWYYWGSRNDDEVRITVSESCRPGRYCLWTRQETFVLEEGETEDFGDYEIEVTEIRSNRASFIVHDEDGDSDDEDGTINVKTPGAGHVYEQGDELEITWDVSDEPRNSSVILDLYDEDDDFVGTIAIEDADEGEYEWDIPERRDYCTQQYPNGLCGYDLDGEFYIKATLVDDYYGYRDEIDEDNSATFEIED